MAQITRNQSAVLSIVAIAAACGVLALYTKHSTRSSTALKRSNAVRRRRRDGPTATIESINSTPDAPLGTLIIKHGEDTRVIHLGISRLPSVDELRGDFPESAEEIRDELEDSALDLAFAACFKATSHTETWVRLTGYHLNHTMAAMNSHDEDRLRLDGPVELRSALHLEDIANEQLERACTRFVTSDRWTSWRDMDSDDTDFDLRAGVEIDPTETEDLNPPSAAQAEPSQGLRGLLYYIAEEDAKRKAYEHRGITCEECGELPIRGVRWHCLNCPDFDLCSTCEMHTVHPKTHVLAKIRIPLPVLSQPTKVSLKPHQEHRLWYPGDPRKVHASLDANLRKRLCQDYDLEEPQLDALYDQFTCNANVPFLDDALGVKGAIDRRAFQKALTCERWKERFAPNAMYDRMFAFYDTDGNGIIDFGEFVSGLAYLRGPKRFASLRRAIEGFDIDGDGYVGRADFSRVFRAKFEIQKQLVNDMVEAQGQEETQAAAKTLRSSQPISSIFSQEDIPLGEVRPIRGKQMDHNGDMQPIDDTRTILADTDPFQSIGEGDRWRLEELLYGSSNRDVLDAWDQIDGTASRPASAEGLDLVDMGAAVGHVRTLALNESGDADLTEPYVQDVFWQAIESGLNELLDPLFKNRELRDNDAIGTYDERVKWRKEIDAVAQKHRQLREDLARGAATDPLVATAMRSYQSADVSTIASPLEPAEIASGERLAPTDWESLERREREIPGKSLDELLSSTGYGIRDADATPDPTLPQNRPDSDTKSATLRRQRGYSEALNVVETSPERPPSQKRLEYLMQMDDVAREVQVRGGAGRLSYHEIENITVAEGRSELRGLIKSWLEWASF